MNGICGFRWAASEFSFWPSCPLLIETDGLRRLVAQWYVARSMTTKLEEEGSYEYASDHHEPNEGHEEAHIEPAVLYQALGEAASDDDSFGEEWRRIFIEYGSRCEQYGGHWKGHRCVGLGIAVVARTVVSLLLVVSAGSLGAPSERLLVQRAHCSAARLGLTLVRRCVDE
jgi:hypothetical protein